MDAAATGALIRKLRKEAGLTQQQLAQQLCVTDKAVSKWERGMGCPDVAVLDALSSALHVDMKNLVSGSLPQRTVQGGNMKRTCFYVCPVCGNIITASANAEISCCGRRIEAVRPAPANEEHSPRLEKVEDEFCLTFDHPMDKQHHLRFVAWVNYDRMLVMRLYPEQDALVRIPQVRMGTLVWNCTQHGLMSAEVRKLLA